LSDKKDKKAKPEVETGPVGGFAFFLSLSVILPVGISSLIVTLRSIDLESVKHLGPFLGGGLLGAFIAHTMVRGKPAVFLHEFKHSFVAGMVGNKWKKMKVDSSSGHFEYSYAKSKAHFNAFISVAPYCIPVFTFLAALFALALFRHDLGFFLGMLGLGYGMDVILNARDISPIQTDISEIKGGYGVGLTYIIAWNLAFFAFLFAFVLHGLGGWLLLVRKFVDLVFVLQGMLAGSNVTPS